MGKNLLHLDQFLVLNRFFLSLFGLQEFTELQTYLKDLDGIYDEEDHSDFYGALIQFPALNPRVKERLDQYDANIREYCNTINSHRLTPIRLKYFQYIAVLCAEIYLDWVFESNFDLIESLNQLLATFFSNQLNKTPISSLFSEFTRKDMNKIAYWMATGSGKTLLLHINLLQFLHYNRGSQKILFDNLLLITPSETLSIQHLEELRLSGIDACLFDQNGRVSNGLHGQQKPIIQILDIYKLTEEKKGQGITVDIENFGSHNIIFVDEGHKGSGGVRWRRFRDFIAQDGFTFEYSATFGQAISAAGKDSSNLLEVYGKSILFDYSYRFFYADGYGKDYRILNLNSNAYSRDIEDTLLIANLLAFYQQYLIYTEFPALMQEYNIERPLWIFVGSKVASQQQQSDVLRIVEFLDQFLQNKEDWATQNIQEILNGHSNLLDGDGQDIFSATGDDPKLSFLLQHKLSPHIIYERILSALFHLDRPMGLHLFLIKKATGEIGLRAGTGDYFGVINIGDENQFLKLLKNTSGIRWESDPLTGSLFEKLAHPQSSIMILIGAKKFLEGWNSWRVSTIGLMNIGKNEGPQVIQLFGRGVRLHGKDLSLKRSKFIDSNANPIIKLVETLNIFGIKANYMDQFNNYLETEGILLNTHESKPLTLLSSISLLDSANIEKKDYRFIQHRFAENNLLELSYDPSIQIDLDLTPQIQYISSLTPTSHTSSKKQKSSTIDSQYFPLIDWVVVYFAVLQYRQEKNWYNIIFSKSILQKLMQSPPFYSLICPIRYLQPQTMEDLRKLQDIIITLLKKYLAAFYKTQKEAWLKEGGSVEN